jgi:hypothetical protein
MKSRENQLEEFKRRFATLKKDEGFGTGLIIVAGFVVLNGLMIAGNLLFPGKTDGVWEWLFLEVGICIVLVGFVVDLREEKVQGRPRWYYAVVYPAI